MKRATFLLMGLLMFGGGVANAADRPNILFCFADDWGRYAGAYAKLEPGGPSDVVSTPNFDRIAKNGVLFKNAFVTAPSCTPCRSSLLSGQYFWRTGRGAILQGAIWDEKIPSYPLLLEDAGYHIGFTYKVWSPGTPANAPYGAGRNSYAKAGGRMNGFSQFVSGKPDIKAAKQTIYDQVRQNFQMFLDDRNKKDQPFCYWYGPTNCHRKWTRGSGKKLWNINPDDLKGKMPKYLPDVPVVREDFADYLGEVQAFDASLGVILDELEKRGELKNTLIAISGDHGIPGFPRGKCNLYDFGTHVPLAISWGDQISGGRVVEDFVNLMDLAPTFLDAAGETPPDVMTGRSLVPVLKSNESGWVDEKRKFVVTGRERHVAAARTDMLPYPQRAIRTKDFLYIRNFKPDRWPMGTAPGYGLPEKEYPDFNTLANNTFAAFPDLDASPTKAWMIQHREDEQYADDFDYGFGLRPGEELYDIRQDPDCLTNLAQESDHSETRKTLSEQLMNVLKSTGDPRVTGDGSQFDQPPFAGPYQNRPQKR